MTTCFGQRVTILRSIRAIIFINLLFLLITGCLYDYMFRSTCDHPQIYKSYNSYNSSYRPEDGHTLTETCSHKDIL